MENNIISFITNDLLENENHNHIYNKKEGKHPFFLQFKQLKYYYNQRKKFKNYLSIGAFTEENNKNESNSLNNPQKKCDEEFYPKNKNIYIA